MTEHRRIGPRLLVSLRRLLVAALTVAWLAAFSRGVLADDPCAAFAWNVKQERALFAGPAREEHAGKTAASAPPIVVNRLYRLALAPQESVSFAAQPGKKALTDGAYAGLVKLHLARGGLYRVSLSQPFWVDLVQDGHLVASSDFTGARGCNAPHKIVQYQLAPGDVVLQLSADVSPQVELAVTRAPQAAAAAPEPRSDAEH